VYRLIDRQIYQNKLIILVGYTMRSSKEKPERISSTGRHSRVPTDCSLADYSFLFPVRVLRPHQNPFGDAATSHCHYALGPEVPCAPPPTPTPSPHHIPCIANEELYALPVLHPSHRLWCVPAWQSPQQFQIKFQVTQ
jgi:hypothetical protein